VDINGIQDNLMRKSGFARNASLLGGMKKNRGENMAGIMPRGAAPQKAANKPVAKVGGRGVTCSVWKQTNKDGKEYFTVTVQRSYTDAEKNWKNTGSFRLQDIPVLTAALNDVYNKYVVKEL
jgi:hypothetical protein